MNIQKVLLINSPFPMKKRYGKGIEKIGTLLPPLGLAYLATTLEKADYKVRILDTQLLYYTIEETINACEKINPDIIGMAVFTGNYNLSIGLCKKIKERLDVLIILGGAHPSLFPMDSIKKGKWGKLKDDINNYTGYFPTFAPKGYKNIEQIKAIKRDCFRKYYLRLSYIFDRLIRIRSINELGRMIKGFIAMVSL